MSETETPQETPQPGSLRKPSHGKGLLRHGSQKGNTPGPGRRPSAIRQRARQGYDERMDLLFAVIDGEMIEQKVLPPGAKEPTIIKRSADLDDRLKALRELRETGLGTLKGTSADEIEDQLRAVVETVGSAEFLSVEQRDRLLKRMEKAWKTREAVTADG